ncbi:MAG: sigma-54 dependent transcriptional regulator [Reichenbachiella sp.]
MQFNEKILLIDDESNFLNTAQLTLQAGGFTHVDVLDDSREVLSFLRKNEIDIITLDLTMPYFAGEELLKKVVDEFPHMFVIILSGIMDVEMVIKCMQYGAKDYIIKPIDDERLCTTISGAARECRLGKENALLSNKCLMGTVENSAAFRDIITNSQTMQNLFSYAEAIAVSPLSILVTGETGTGKELIAKALHNLKHSDAPFVACNVAGIDDVAFSDTLFGHIKGAFTGADMARSGMIEKAQGGTLFLDEIGDLSPESQVKLLRLLQEGEYIPLGADEPKKSSAWIVVATHKSLGNDPSFRKDLYFRLKAHCIQIPPLRDRLEDIPLLVHHFVAKYKPDLLDAERVTLSRKIERIVAGQALTGNIRELEGIVADLTFTDGIIQNGTTADDQRLKTDDQQLVLKFDDFPTMNEIKIEVIKNAVAHCEGNKTSAAKLLGVSRQTIFSQFKDA